MQDDINAELDARKLTALIQQGVVIREDIANAPVVLVCECGREQAVENDECEGCGGCLL
jgi:hypothetical protein